MSDPKPHPDHESEKAERVATIPPTTAAVRIAAERAAFFAKLLSDGIGEEEIKKMWNAKLDADDKAADELRAAIKRTEKELMMPHRRCFEEDPDTVLYGCDDRHTASVKRMLQREKAAAEEMEARTRRIAAAVEKAKAEKAEAERIADVKAKAKRIASDAAAKGRRIWNKKVRDRQIAAAKKAEAERIARLIADPATAIANAAAAKAAAEKAEADRIAAAEKVATCERRAEAFTEACVNNQMHPMLALGLASEKAAATKAASEKAEADLIIAIGPVAPTHKLIAADAATKGRQIAAAEEAKAEKAETERIAAEATALRARFEAAKAGTGRAAVAKARRISVEKAETERIAAEKESEEKMKKMYHDLRKKHFEQIYDMVHKAFERFGPPCYVKGSPREKWVEKYKEEHGVLSDSDLRINLRKIRDMFNTEKWRARIEKRPMTFGPAAVGSREYWRQFEDKKRIFGDAAMAARKRNVKSCARTMFDLRAMSDQLTVVYEHQKAAAEKAEAQ